MIVVLVSVTGFPEVSGRKLAKFHSQIKDEDPFNKSATSCTRVIVVWYIFQRSGCINSSKVLRGEYEFTN